MRWDESWPRELLTYRLERPLHPRFGRLAVLLSRIPAQVLRHVERFIVECFHVRRDEHAGFHRRAVAGNPDEQDRLAREDRRIGRNGNQRRRERHRTRVEAEVVLIVGWTELVARAGALFAGALHRDTHSECLTGCDRDLPVEGLIARCPNRQVVNPGRQVHLRTVDGLSLDGDPRPPRNSLQYQTPGWPRRGRRWTHNRGATGVDRCDAAG